MIEEVPRVRRRGARRAVLALIIALIVALGGGASWFVWATGGSSGGKTVTVAIPPGASAQTIADRLADAGVVRSAFAFRLVARVRGVSADFKPGTYKLRTGLGVSDAIDQLRTGIPEEVERFTIPEGLTVRETARRVGEKTHVSAGAFLKALVRERDVPAPLKAVIARKKTLTPETFEGFLFPDTYEIFKKATAADVVRRMLDRFDQATTDLNLQRGANRLDGHELVIVASLVEKEARCREDLIKGEAPCANDHVNIASVIYNRLARPMRLQIDATIQYVYIQRTGRAKNPLQETDYQLDSPYNTYRIDGLPPTPIGSPGLASLTAAVRPADTGFFFYRLCNPDALRFGHIFGRTLEERDSKYRSDPRCA